MKTRLNYMHCKCTTIKTFIYTRIKVNRKNREHNNTKLNPWQDTKYPVPQQILSQNWSVTTNVQGGFGHRFHVNRCLALMQQVFNNTYGPSHLHGPQYRYITLECFLFWLFITIKYFLAAHSQECLVLATPNTWQTTDEIRVWAPLHNCSIFSLKRKINPVSNQQV